MQQKIETLTVKQLKLWNLVLSALSILFSMVFTSLIIASKFQLFKTNSPALNWTATGIILLIIVGVYSLKKVNKWVKKLEYSDFRQFVLFLLSLVPLVILVVIVGLMKNHFVQTMDCIVYIIALFAVDKVILYFKSFFEYELDIVKEAKKKNRIESRQARL